MSANATPTKVTAEDAREAMAQIGQALSPEDLFPPIEKPADYNGVRYVFAELSRKVHPDLVPARLHDEAALAYGKLAMLYAAHTQNAADASVKQHHIETLSSEKYAYTIRDGNIGGTEISNLYLAERSGAAETKTCVLHLSMPTVKHSMAAIDHEAKILAILARDGEPNAAAFFPRHLESVGREDSAGAMRANALDGYGGTISLEMVKSLGYPGGLDLRSVAWIWRRMLFAIGNAHAAGVYHGDITPKTVRILPAEHGLVLTNWTRAYAGNLVPPIKPERGRTADPEFYADELFSGTAAGPGSDIYMATKLMNWLMTPEDREQPELAAFIAGCTLPYATGRPTNAFKLKDEFEEILLDLFGPRAFTPMVLTGSVTNFILPT
jgi:hypothetical protein